MDYDNDGHFEIYFGDNDGSPLNIESYYAENLTVRFKAHYPDTTYMYMMSAGMPTLVDCDNDGLKDIVVYIGPTGGQEDSTGIGILSAKDGSIIRADHNISGFSEHRWLYNLPVYDIDLDGNPELILSSNNFLVFDLVDWTMDFLSTTSGAGRWQPTIADVTGDGYMEIIIGRSDFLEVYDRTLTRIARIPESGSLPGEDMVRSIYVTDLDADGLNEIILSPHDGTIVVIETEGRATYGGSRAGENGYSIYRQCVAEYVSILDLMDEQPTRESTDVSWNPTLSVMVQNWQDELMDITFRTNASGSWRDIGVYTSVGDGFGSGTEVDDGLYNVSIDGPIDYNTIYTWYVNVTDGTYWTKETFHFRTAPSEPELSSEFPDDGATKVDLNPTLQITIHDWQGDSVNWWIRTNASGSWITLNNGTLLNGSGTVDATTSAMDQDNTTYWWSVHATDSLGSGSWKNKTYKFTTRPQPPIHVFTLDHESHMTYGLSYPVTYIFDISPYSTDLRAYKYVNSWSLIPTKNETDVYSGVEAARFDYSEDKAYISVSFPTESDTVYIKITDNSDALAYAEYVDVSLYYDNSKAAFVLTGDDWCATQDAAFKAACDACQARNIWFTAAIVTQGVAKYSDWHYPPDWSLIQNETDEGFVEPASHSRHHLYVPYNQEQWGVQSSYDGEIGIEWVWQSPLMANQ